MDFEKPKRNRGLLHEEKVVNFYAGGMYPCEACYGSDIYAHFDIIRIHQRTTSKEERALFRKIKPKCQK